MPLAEISKNQAQQMGDQLRLARERQGKTLVDIGRQITIPPGHLRAIECGDFKPFYSPHFFQHAAKRYAQALDLRWEQIEGHDNRATISSEAELNSTSPLTEKKNGETRENRAVDSRVVEVTNSGAMRKNSKKRVLASFLAVMTTLSIALFYTLKGELLGNLFENKQSMVENSEPENKLSPTPSATPTPMNHATEVSETTTRAQLTREDRTKENKLLSPNEK